MNLVDWRSSTWRDDGEVAVAADALEVHAGDAAELLDGVVEAVERGAASR